MLSKKCNFVKRISPFRCVSGNDDDNSDGKHKHYLIIRINIVSVKVKGLVYVL